MKTHVLDYLESSEPASPARLVVVFGSEPFLKQTAVDRLQREVAGDEEDVPFTTLSGPKAEWRDVNDELSTRSLFSSGPRLVRVDDADSFVTRYRGELEDYAEQTRKTGVLLLNVTKFPGNTKLAKAAGKHGLTIDCRPPTGAGGRAMDTSRVSQWLVAWARDRHDFKLSKDAAAKLLELVGENFGIMEQELSKLSAFAAAGDPITADRIQEITGGWRMQSVWELADAAAEGNVAEALKQLDRLLQAGEEDGLLPQLAWSLRRYATATQIYREAEQDGRRISLSQAAAGAGVKSFETQRFEQRLKQMGRHRAGKLHRWLLEADRALKSTHSGKGRKRIVLEMLVARLARELAAPRRASK